MIERGPAYNWFPPNDWGWEGFDRFVERWTAWGRDSLTDGDVFAFWPWNNEESNPRARLGLSCSLLARDTLRRLLGLDPIARA